MPFDSELGVNLIDVPAGSTPELEMFLTNICQAIRQKLSQGPGTGRVLVECKGPAGLLGGLKHIIVDVYEAKE